jgi:hypothetical protein
MRFFGVNCQLIEVPPRAFCCSALVAGTHDFATVSAVFAGTGLASTGLTEASARPALATMAMTFIFINRLLAKKPQPPEQRAKAG